MANHQEVIGNLTPDIKSEANEGASDNQDVSLTTNITTPERKLTLFELERVCFWMMVDEIGFRANVPHQRPMSAVVPLRGRLGRK